MLILSCENHITRTYTELQEAFVGKPTFRYCTGYMDCDTDSDTESSSEI